MIPCGEYKMREGDTETHGGDGINGTIVVPQSKVEAAGAGPKEKVRVKVEAKGQTLTMERKIHSSGNTLTIPLKKREELNLEPGDTIEFWIEAVDADEESGTDEIQKTLAEKEKEANGKKANENFVVIGNSFTYHLVESEDDEETVCGLGLENDDIRTGSDPGDFLDACPECKAHSSESMSPDEVVALLNEKVDEFKDSEGPATQFSNGQLNAVKDIVLELDHKKAKVREFKARVARLEQRIQELEADEVESG